jgi:hypothetical protein
VTGNRPFHNSASQSERRAVLKNEREAGTYAAFAESDAGIARGRFTGQQKSMVIGSSGPVRYPALPPNSPWARDPVPDEPPIGIDISAAPVVGECHEITASLAESIGEGIDPPASLPNDRPGGDGPARSRGHSSSQAAATSPLSQSKQKSRRKD